MAVRRVESKNLRLIQRTDVTATHVIVFAHGYLSGENLSDIVGNEAKPFKIPKGKQVLHYIPDHCAFSFKEGTFLTAFKGLLEPLEIKTEGKDAQNYNLTKAFGKYTRTAGQTAATEKLYEKLEVEVERSPNVKDAILPTKDHRLGLGRPCDILSIRNHELEPGQTLRFVVNNKLLEQYTYVHCFFGREWFLEFNEAKAPNLR